MTKNEPALPVYEAGVMIHKGLTIRDVMAMVAMHATLQGENPLGFGETSVERDKCAARWYQWADAMIANRELGG